LQDEPHDAIHRPNQRLKEKTLATTATATATIIKNNNSSAKWRRKARSKV
jgi:hypothetical protein